MTGVEFHMATVVISGTVSAILMALIALRPDYWTGAEGLPRMWMRLASALWHGVDTSRETRLGLHWTCATSGAGAQAVCALGGMMLVAGVPAGATILLWGWAWTGVVMVGWGLAAFLAGGHHAATAP
jgi:hypothetical protein